MCIVSEKVKFCTCVNTNSYENLPHYWVLHRFDKHKDLQLIGEAMISLDFLQKNHQVNKQTLEKRLNEPDVFDTPIEFKPKDQLEIVINNLARDHMERMRFNFIFKKNKWVWHEFGPFELMNRYDEISFGDFKELEK